MKKLENQNLGYWERNDSVIVLIYATLFLKLFDFDVFVKSGEIIQATKNNISSYFWYNKLCFECSFLILSLVSIHFGVGYQIDNTLFLMLDPNIKKHKRRIAADVINS